MAKRVELKRISNPRTILTDKMIATFADLVKNGVPFDAVCDFLGVHSRTFWDWQRKGEHYLQSDCTPPEFAVYGEFMLEVKRALAEYRIERVKKLNTGRDWVRQLSILERRDRRNFSVKPPEGGEMSDYDPDERYL